MDEKDPPKRLDLARLAVDFVVLRGMVCALLDTEDETGEPRPPFEGKTPWVEAPLYRLAPRPTK